MLTNMDKLYESVAANGPVCVGLDTEISYLPTTDTAKTAGENVVAFNRALIDATSDELAEWVASQTADIAFTSKPLRRIGTLHGLVAFIFNTVVLALTINLLASLF